MKIGYKILPVLLSVAALFSCSGNVDPEDDADRTDDGGSTVVTPVPGDTPVSGYAQKMIGMQFTSTGCVECPLLAQAVKNIMEDYPGTLIPVAFHMDYTDPDPMTLSINRKFYDKVSLREDSSIGLPMFALNFRQGSRHIVNEYSKMVSEIALQAESYPVVCGVAMDTSYDPSSRKLDLTVRFRADVAGEYRWHIFLVEDGISYSQAGAESAGYVHDNVLRAVLSDNVLGTKLNSGKPLEAGIEYKVTKSEILDASWNPDNVRVVAAMLNTVDEGRTYGSNNANECPAGGSADYQYVDEDEE